MDANPLADLRDVAVSEQKDQQAVEDDQQRQYHVDGQVEDPAVGLDGGRHVPGQEPVAQHKGGEQADGRRPEPPSARSDGQEVPPS
jgi:hypothetical protein